MRVRAIFPNFSLPGESDNLFAERVVTAPFPGDKPTLTVAPARKGLACVEEVIVHVHDVHPQETRSGEREMVFVSSTDRRTIRGARATTAAVE